MRISAVRFASVHCDFGQAITFAGAHWLEGRRFANDGIARAKRFGFGQTFGSETANLFVAGEDEREWLLQFFEITIFNGSECSGDESLGVARAAAKQLSVCFS